VVGGRVVAVVVGTTVPVAVAAGVAGTSVVGTVVGTVVAGTVVATVVWGYPPGDVVQPATRTASRRAAPMMAYRAGDILVLMEILTIESPPGIIISSYQ
jgi:hypothetical protein